MSGRGQVRGEILAAFRDTAGWIVRDEAGHPLVTLPADWPTEVLDAWIAAWETGHAAGLALGRRHGREALQRELRALIGAPTGPLIREFV